MIIGSPFTDQCEGEWDGLTLWEQIDNGQQFTPTKKYLTALPIFMFLLSTHYTRYDSTLFMVNVIPLMIVLIAKLPALHRVRFFGINKVDYHHNHSHSQSSSTHGVKTRKGHSLSMSSTMSLANTGGPSISAVGGGD